MNSKIKTGVLIVNLGTPDSPETADVRKYLREFLMDWRVIDIPFLNRWLLVNLIIAPFRSPKSAIIYKKLWTPEGSPLKIYGQRNEKQLQSALGENFIVKLAMRYQKPSIEKGLKALRDEGVKEIIILPLFPQYASASTGSVYQEVNRVLSTWQTIPKLKIVSNFYDHPKFIEGFVQNAKKIMSTRSFEHVLFSYHGMPERQTDKGHLADNNCETSNCRNEIHAENQLCYRAQCYATTRLLVEKLKLKEGEYTTCFQSRLGKAEWIKPYSPGVIEKLAKKGVKSVMAFSPAFVADCLETTIEVGEEFKELFLEHGGEDWALVPSLNDSKTWIDLLKDLSLNS